MSKKHLMGYAMLLVILGTINLLIDNKAIGIICMIVAILDLLKLGGGRE